MKSKKLFVAILSTALMLSLASAVSASDDSNIKVTESSSAFADSTTISTTDLVQQGSPSLDKPVINIVEQPAPPTPHYTQNDIVSQVSSKDDVGILNQQKDVTVTMNCSLSDWIFGSIVYTEDNGTAESWGGTLQRENVVQNSTNITITYSGVLYKDIDAK